MLTVFAVCKPFIGIYKTIQTNAIRSWQQMLPEPEILIFGDRRGVKRTCGELGVTFVPGVKRGATGMDLMSDAFYKATRLASNNLLMYVNADMILPPNFCRIVESIDAEYFMMIGARTNLDVTVPLNFSMGWWSPLKALAQTKGATGGVTSMDYFVFRRGSLTDPPELVAGAWYSDNVLVERALAQGIPVIDATDVVLAIHQNHPHKGGLAAWSTGAESMQAKSYLTGELQNLAHATYRLG